jgi:hypothetical protein
MRVAVFHKEGDSFDRMCVVETPNDNLDSALEYAYRWTNNIEGSWSRKGNADWNENVTDIAPLEDGYGHRSSMVGDRLITGDGQFEVAPFGFKQIELPQAAIDEAEAIIAKLMEAKHSASDLGIVGTYFQAQIDREFEAGIERGMKETV